MPDWLNGKLVDHATIDVTDRGFTLGDGLFETMRLSQRMVRHFDRHMARLNYGANILGIPVPYSEKELTSAIDQLVVANGLENGVIRLTLTRGPGARGILPPAVPHPTLVITMAASSPPLGAARVCISTLVRRNENSPLSSIKTLNYLDAILARKDAVDRGFDDVILLNNRGNVAETSVSSIFAVIGGRLYTPPVSDGALQGVARGLVIEHMGAQERSMVPADLFAANEVILTNALGCRPVTAIDETPILQGEIFNRIQSLVDNS